MDERDLKASLHENCLRRLHVGGLGVISQLEDCDRVVTHQTTASKRRPPHTTHKHSRLIEVAVCFTFGGPPSQNARKRYLKRISVFSHDDKSISCDATLNVTPL
jgi:hypothetical protein